MITVILLTILVVVYIYIGTREQFNILSGRDSLDISEQITNNLKTGLGKIPFILNTLDCPTRFETECELDRDYNIYRPNYSCKDCRNVTVPINRCAHLTRPTNINCDNLVPPNEIIPSRDEVSSGPSDIGIVNGNKMCWLMLDKNISYPSNMYGLSFNCRGYGDKFDINKLDDTDQYYITKIVNGKPCKMIMTSEGIDQGSRMYNVALSCNDIYDKYDKMKLKVVPTRNTIGLQVNSPSATFQKIHPVGRNRCYMTQIPYNGVHAQPVFQCYSTPMAAGKEGSFLSFP